METTIQKRRLAGAAAIVMSALILSRLTGFLRSTFIMNIIGDKVKIDAYYLAFGITDFMFNLLIGGAIAAALIPIMSGYLARNEEEEGWKVLSTFVNVITILMVITCILGILFSPQIVEIQGHNYNAETKTLAVSLTRILFPSVCFMMLAGITNGVLNSYQRFAAAAYGPSLYNIGCALSILLFSRYGVKTVVLGIMLSALVYFLFQFSFVFKNLKYYRFKIDLKHHGFIRLVKLAVPSLVSSSIMQVNLLISAYFAGKFVSGSLAAYRQANDVSQMPFGIFAVGIGQAILPSLSEKLALGDVKGYRTIFSKGLRMTLLFAIPSGIAFLTLHMPIMSAIYKWSKKADPNVINMSGQVLMFFSLSVVFSSMIAVMNRAFYANNNTKTPMYIGICSILSTIAFNQIFYRFTSLKASGMSLAFSLSTVLNVTLLFIFLRKYRIGVNLRKLAVYFLKILTAAAIMGGVLWFVNKYTPIHNGGALSEASKMKVLESLLLEVVIGVVVYFGAVLLMRVQEGIYIVETILDRVKAVIGRGAKIFH